MRSQEKIGYVFLPFLQELKCVNRETEEMLHYTCCRITLRNNLRRSFWFLSSLQDHRIKKILVEMLLLLKSQKPSIACRFVTRLCECRLKEFSMRWKKVLNWPGERVGARLCPNPPLWLSLEEKSAKACGLGVYSFLGLLEASLIL